ncbi:hypothetical protein [Bdellovibrio sp. BCCA]|uniref:hypothetical protein n=1 Tax=Bdellovibrio sp. BCCA TaxID=3136281 RepID=UPI0030F0F606
MSRRKQKYLTPDQVIDYIYEHKADYNWVNKKVAAFNHKRLDDYISEFIIGYLSASKSKQIKFASTEDLGKYLTQSMVNRVKTAYRGVARHKKFTDQSLQITHHQKILDMIVFKSGFDVIEELVDLAVIAKKTWRPAVAEENLKVIMTIPDTKDPKELEIWYEKRKALIIRLYKTYRKKFKQKKESKFVNPAAAVGIIEGYIESGSIRYPQKKNGKTKQIAKHDISFDSLMHLSEMAESQAEKIRMKLNESGFFKRLTSGGIVTGKERVELERKNKLNELVSISRKAKSLVSEKGMTFEEFDSGLVKKFIDLSNDLNLHIETVDVAEVA